MKILIEIKTKQTNKQNLLVWFVFSGIIFIVLNLNI